VLQLLHLPLLRHMRNDPVEQPQLPCLLHLHPLLLQHLRDQRVVTAPVQEWHEQHHLILACEMVHSLRNGVFRKWSLGQYLEDCHCVDCIEVH